MTFPEFLKRIRNTSGYTQQNVADLLGVDRSTYSYYETGKTEPNLRFIKMLANLYSLRIDDLVNCRYVPMNLELASPEPEEQPLIRLNRFRMLDREEQHLVLLYRDAKNKESFLDYVRNYTDPSEEDEIE